MHFRVSSRLHHLLAVCLCSLALASVALVGIATSTAHVADASLAGDRLYL